MCPSKVLCCCNPQSYECFWSAHTRPGLTLSIAAQVNQRMLQPQASSLFWPLCLRVLSSAMGRPWGLYLTFNMFTWVHLCHQSRLLLLPQAQPCPSNSPEQRTTQPSPYTLTKKGKERMLAKMMSSITPPGESSAFQSGLEWCIILINIRTFFYLFLF